MLWAPLEQANVRNPYRMYQQLRDTAPVHRAQTGEYIISRYEDVRTVLKDTRCLAGNRLQWMSKGVHYLQNREEDFRAITQAMQSFLLFKNPPDHGNVRKFIAQCWSDRDVENLVRENIHELLSELPSEKFDLVNDFAKNLPALTITKILGLPPQDYRMLKSWASALVKSLDLYISLKDLVSIHHASRDFITYFREHAQRLHLSESKGLISSMLRTNEANGNKLSEDELISIFIFLFVSGEETTVSLVSTGIFNLVQKPSQWELLKSNPALSASAIQELLRYDSPVQLLGRIAGDDMTLDGVSIQAGSTLTLVIGSANRDASVFASADDLDITRTPNRHLAFGTGIHKCLGDWLAELQGRLAIEALMEKFPDMQLHTTQPEWNNNLAIRSLKRLEVGAR